MSAGLIIAIIVLTEYLVCYCGFYSLCRGGISLCFQRFAVYSILQHNKTHPKLQAFTGAFDVELFLIAKAQKLKVKEVSVGNAS